MMLGLSSVKQHAEEERGSNATCDPTHHEHPKGLEVLRETGPVTERGHDRPRT